MKAIEYAELLDEQTVGTVIKNGPADSPTYFVQGENGNWWPSTPTGRLLQAVTTYVPDGGFRSGRVHLPAVTVDVADAARDEAATILVQALDSRIVDGNEEEVADTIVEALTSNGLLRGAR